MSFVHFTDADGRDAYVDPLHISGIYQMPQSTNSYAVFVQEHCLLIVSRATAMLLVSARTQAEHERATSGR